MSEDPTTTDGGVHEADADTAVIGGPPQATPSGPAAQTRAGKISKRRLVLVDVLIGVTTLLAIVGMFSVWANRLLFNPDQWEAQSTELLQNPSIRNATAQYLVDQLYANVNIPGLLESALPTRLKPLAAPAAGALENVAVQGVEEALQRPRVQTLWAKANRAADQTFIIVVNGGKGPVGIQKGVVTLDLGSIVDSVAAQLGLPSDLSSKLPPSIATLTLFQSSQISAVQTIGKAVKGLALWLTILVPLLYALAIFLARGHRRRTLMSVGFAIVFAGLAGFGIRAILESKITDAIATDASLREPIRAAVVIGTELLSQVAGAFLLVGAVIVVAAWFAGPARIIVPVRRAIAPFMRLHPLPTFAITTALMVLVFFWNPIPATGTLGGIIVFLALALFGTAMLRLETAHEFPDAMPGDATAALRARISGFRERRHHDHATNGAHPATIPDQLDQLATMRDSGRITPEEYDSAKQALLRT